MTKDASSQTVAGNQTKIIPLSGSFKYAFFGVMGLTLLSFVGTLWLVREAKGNEAAKDLLEVFSTTWKMGFGGFLGLIGGKAL